MSILTRPRRVLIQIYFQTGLPAPMGGGGEQGFPARVGKPHCNRDTGSHPSSSPPVRTFLAQYTPECALPLTKEHGLKKDQVDFWLRLFFNAGRLPTFCLLPEQFVLILVFSVQWVLPQPASKGSSLCHITDVCGRKLSVAMDI